MFGSFGNRADTAMAAAAAPVDGAAHLHRHPKIR
jgi:hypothetical protein